MSRAKDVHFVTWNVKALNNPMKRKKVFAHLVDLVFTYNRGPQIEKEMDGRMEGPEAPPL